MLSFLQSTSTTLALIPICKVACYHSYLSQARGHRLYRLTHVFCRAMEISQSKM